MTILTLQQALEEPGLRHIKFPIPEAAGLHHARPQAVIHWDREDHYQTLNIPSDYFKELQAKDWTRDDKGYWITMTPPDNPLRPILQQFVDAIAAKYPGTKSRAERAAGLVLYGRVDPLVKLHKMRPHNYWVFSSSTPGRTYEVYIDPNNRKHWSCMIIQDPVTKHSHVDCPDIYAPFLKHGRRCKHMLAAWMYAEIHGYNKEPGPPHQEDPGSAGKENEALPVATSHSTTPAPPSQPRRLVAKYADGRPAKYSDGTIVRYTAGGKPVLLPASSW